jgi:hypothetical protein
MKCAFSSCRALLAAAWAFSATLGLMEFIFRGLLFHLDSLWAFEYLPLRRVFLTAIKPRAAPSHSELSEFEGKIMRISSTDVIEGGRVLYTIGKTKAASAWHAANGAHPKPIGVNSL